MFNVQCNITTGIMRGVLIGRLLKVEKNVSRAAFSSFSHKKQNNLRNPIIILTPLSCGSVKNNIFEFKALPHNNFWRNITTSTSLLKSDESLAAQILMSSPELIQSDGFQVETHQVTTDDGYILSLLRVKLLVTGNHQRPSKGSVLLQHGLLSSSDDWLILRPGHDNLPYLLAHNGYDVFLGNFRGCRYSVGHLNYSHEMDRKYWDFGVHEMGLYDVPSLIRKVLEISKTDRLAYIGYSMGATSFFICMDQWPQLNNKVDRMIALAPAGYIGQATSPLNRLARAVPPKFIHNLLNRMNDGHVIPQKMHLKMKQKAQLQIKKEELDGRMAAAERFERFIRLFDGHNPGSITNETAKMILSHVPSDTSTKTLAHFHQLWVTQKFCQFDYGKRKNLQKYQSTVPPSYNLSSVTCPVSILYGLNDKLVDSKDVLRLAEQLGNVTECDPVKDKLCNHLDFVYGKKAGDLIYKPCLKHLGS